MTANIIADIMTGNIRSGFECIDFTAVQNTLQEYKRDRRFKIKRLAESGSSGLFIWDGIKYHWYLKYDQGTYTYTTVIVERA